MPQYIHVNQHRLRRGEPPLTSKPSRSRTGPYGNQVDILDAAGNVVARVRFTPDRPLPCGARAYIECYHGTEVHE